MKIFLVSFLVLLAVGGCASTREPLRETTKIIIPCKIAPPAKPVFAFSTATKETPTLDKVVLLLAERNQRIGYETELEAAVQACQ